MQKKHSLYRSVALTASAIIAIFSMMLYTACNKDKCGSTTCQNSAACINGKCVCPTGFYGDDCGSSWSTNFLGTYKCTQTCSPSLPGGSWTSTITSNGNSTQDSVIIASFGNAPNNTVYAGVDGNNNLYLTSSSLSSRISGTGKYNNDTLTIRYSSGAGYVCTLIMVKQ